MKLADPLSERPDVAALIEQLRPARVVWLLPPSMPFAAAADVRAMIRDEAPEVFQLPEVERAPDKIHATPKGYAVLAEAAWMVIGSSP